MNTHNVKVEEQKVRVTHVAFACGCVRSFTDEAPAETAVACKEHGDYMVSTIQELIPLQSAA